MKLKSSQKVTDRFYIRLLCCSQTCANESATFWWHAKPGSICITLLAYKWNRFWKHHNGDRSNYKFLATFSNEISWYPLRNSCDLHKFKKICRRKLPKNVNKAQILCPFCRICLAFYLHCSAFYILLYCLSRRTLRNLFLFFRRKSLSIKNGKKKILFICSFT